MKHSSKYFMSFVKFFPDVCLAVLHCTADLPITSGGGTLRSRGCHDGCYTAAYGWQPRWGRGHRVEGRCYRFLPAVVIFCTSVAALCRLLTFVWCVSFGKQSHIMHRSSTLHCDLIRRTFNVDMSVVTSSIRFRNVLDLMSNSYNAPSKICR